MDSGMLNDRQKAILYAAIDEFIESAVPVASSRIVDKYHFPYSAATVRNDFLELDEHGYLYQPHTSAGRIPTDKGYRFYADSAFPSDEGSTRAQKMLVELCRISEESEEEDFIRTASRTIATLSHNVTCAGFLEGDLFYKSGFAEVFNEPEFDDGAIRKTFATLIDDIDNFLAEMITDEGIPLPRAFIGSENPVMRAREYSVLISSFATPFRKNGIIGIIGPKRMDYRNNMLLLRELQTLW